MDERLVRAAEAVGEWASASEASNVFVAPGVPSALVAMCAYEWEAGHAETRERVTLPIDMLHNELWKQRGLRWSVVARERVASNSELLLVHSREMVESFSALESGTVAVNTRETQRLQSGESSAGADEGMQSHAVRETPGREGNGDNVATSSAFLNVLTGMTVAPWTAAEGAERGRGAAGAVIAKAARVAAGCLLDLVDRALEDQAQHQQCGCAMRALCLTRPPGHHCTATRSGGNGVLNNVAMAAAYAAKRGVRVCIVDIDVHYSGGTVDIMRGAPLSCDATRVMDGVKVIDVYGARGQEVRDWAREHGRRWRIVERVDNAVLINVALLDGEAGDHVYCSESVLGVVESELQEHRAEVVLVSCGYDAAQGDSEGFQLTPRGYHRFFSGVLKAAGRAPVIAVLEGGYKPAVVAQCAMATLLALQGLELRKDECRPECE